MTFKNSIECGLNTSVSFHYLLDYILKKKYFGIDHSKDFKIHAVDKPLDVRIRLKCHEGSQIQFDDDICVLKSQDVTIVSI